MNELLAYLRSREGSTVTDDAILGCLTDDDAREIAGEFEVSMKQFSAAISQVIQEGY